MSDCQKSCLDSIKLTTLAIAIMFGLLIQVHVVRAEDHTIACADTLIEQEPGTAQPA